MEELVEEEWRPIVGYEGWYSISSLGRVRRDRSGIRTHAGRIQKASVNGRGYQVVGLTNGSHKSLRQFSVHRLVAEAFLGPRPDGCGINHINGIKVDNRVENLEWATGAENSRHAARLGLLATGDRQGARLRPETRPRGDNHPARLRPDYLSRGEKHGNARLTEDAVRDILTSTLSEKQLADKYGVAASTVGWVRKRKTWRHVSA